MGNTIVKKKSELHTHIRQRDSANKAARHDAVVVRPLLVSGGDNDEVVGRLDRDFLLSELTHVHRLVELVCWPQSALLNQTTGLQ